MSFSQELPKTGLSSPPMVMLLPHRFTGISTGACTWLPERIPGEPVVSAWAEVPEARCLPVPAPLSRASSCPDARLPEP